MSIDLQERVHQVPIVRNIDRWKASIYHLSRPHCECREIRNLNLEMNKDCSEVRNAKTFEATDNVNNKGKSAILPSIPEVSATHDDFETAYS